MSTKKLNLRWINIKQRDQFDWLFNHLDRKGLLPTAITKKYQTTHKDLREELSKWPNTAEYREYLNDMSNAWSQEQQRKKEGQKSYSFVLSADTKSDLDKLAKLQDLKLKECLTKIISSAYNGEKKNRLQLIEVENKHQEEKNHDQLLIKALGLILGDALNEIAIYKTNPTRNNTAPPAPSESQESEIKKAYEAAREELIIRNIDPKLFSLKKITGHINRPTSERAIAHTPETIPPLTPAPTLTENASTPTETQPIETQDQQHSNTPEARETTLTETSNNTPHTDKGGTLTDSKLTIQNKKLSELSINIFTKFNSDDPTEPIETHDSDTTKPTLN